jgi:protein-S-isoprenylcysteine O-methyltransferase Ste14
MRTTTAAAGSAAFLVIAPGTVAGLAPWWLTGWRAGTPYPLPLRAGGAVLVALGALALLYSFIRFVIEGTGTPAPAAPTQRLVIGGLYRYVRNPMYLAVLAVIVGQALLLSRPVLLIYAAVVGAAVGAFVRWHEEPTLGRRYGAQYEAYRREVPAWWPRRPRAGKKTPA